MSGATPPNTPPKTSVKRMRGPSQGAKYYLVAYNAFSCLGWAYVLVATSFHLLGFSSTPSHPYRTASTTLAHIISSIPFVPKFASALPTKTFIATKLPEFLLPLYERMQCTYIASGPATALVQSFAALEIIHSLTGLVKSPIVTTLIQVFSRLFLVWGITERFDATRTNPLYASMVLAWSLTEVIRYAFYAITLLNKQPPFLLYLRYTTFYILYPLGASSEAFLIYATLPNSRPGKPTAESLIYGTWFIPDYIRGLMFILWWPGLFLMFSHMVKQRAKIYGGGKARTKIQ